MGVGANARVGGFHLEGVAGASGPGSPNPRGLQFATRIGLLHGALLNTFESVSRRQGFTFFPGDPRQTPQQIDFVVVPQWAVEG
eukprot:10838718-Alexandrium_andersonii.AAC.1